MSHANDSPKNLRALARTAGLIAALGASLATSACSSSTPPSGTDGAATGIDAAMAGTDAAMTGTDAAATADLAMPRPAAAFFRGTLAGTVAASKAMSDPFFMGVQAQAMAAGDNGHDALLGTTHLGTVLNQFVGLDTWSSDANMDAVYADPHVGQFAAAFYASPPEFKTFYLSDFYQWGNTDSGDASTPHYFVMVRGRFKDAPDKIKTMHDAIVQAAETDAKNAGEVAHLAYYGRQDPKDALFVDIWSADTNIDAYYSNQQLQAAIGALFDADGPNLGVYSSTDWVTW